MNKLIIITRKLVMVILMVWTSFSVFAKSPSNAEIIKRVTNLNTVINVKVTDDVTDFIINHVEKRRRESELLLGRTSLYFPTIENALRSKNLPDELKYIAVIESGLLPDAESHQGAAGIWQFMRSTAELFGLKIDKHIDERKDLNRATDKALDYLKLLYEAYGNWTLALAAYNCGTGTVSKAIKKANGQTDYWAIQKYLPRETQKYIPRFIAASYLMNYYYIHELQPKEPSEDLRNVMTVQVMDKVEFKKLSKELDMDISLIRFLNPMFRKDFIPEIKNGNYFLTLPHNKMMAYKQLYNVTNQSVETLAYQESNTTKDSRGFMLIHPLAGIATRFHAVRDNLKDSSMIRQLAQSNGINNNQFKLYKLKRLESLSDVADANNIPLNELLAMNNIDEKQGLPPGSIIKMSK